MSVFGASLISKELNLVLKIKLYRGDAEKCYVFLFSATHCVIYNLRTKMNSRAVKLLLTLYLFLYIS